LSNETVIKYFDALMEKIINEWGFRYIKLDFLYAGMLNGKFKNGGSAYLWYNRALKVLTSRKKNKNGEAVVYLGCGMPFESSASYLPLSRIGPDTKEDWDMNLLKNLHFSGRPGAFCNSQSTLGHAFWDQSIFINDPDVIFLRDTNSSLTHNEKELIALVNFLFAGQIMISDDMTETATSFTKEIVCLFEKFIAEEFGQVNLTDEVYVIFNRTGTYCGLINLSKKEIAVPLVEFNDILKKQTTNDYKKSATAQGSGFKPVIAHGAVTTDFITTQPHSISIYSRNYYGR
jgi:alpha-galactosidase